ncbi:MAG: RNA polymerase sigma-70 factor [Bacteroidales bacterium]
MLSASLQIKIKNNDVAAFEKIFREYYAPLCMYAMQFVDDKDVAEEIVQDFFYRYWKNRQKMNIRISLKNYLYQSVRNSSLKYLRHEAVKQKYADTINQSARSSFPEYGEKELQSIIDGVLESLPERCNKIFRMNRFEDLTYKKIAAKLSVSVKTVEADMGKALKAFRQKLSEYQE